MLAAIAKRSCRIEASPEIRTRVQRASAAAGVKAEGEPHKCGGT
jgi:hypothetical protein